MTVHVGQKVVCVPHPDAVVGVGGGPSPVYGETYTIRDVDHRLVRYGGPIAVRLEELTGAIVLLPSFLGGGFWEVASDAKNFRPVIEKKTDISIFTAMLNLDSSVIGESVPQTALSPEQQKEDHAS